MIDGLSLLLGLLLGSIGLGYCIYGRKQKNTLLFWVGIALMGLPYLIDNHILLLVVALLLMFLPRYLN